MRRPQLDLGGEGGVCELSEWRSHAKRGLGKCVIVVRLTRPPPAPKWVYLTNPIWIHIPFFAQFDCICTWPLCGVCVCVVEMKIPLWLDRVKDRQVRGCKSSHPTRLMRQKPTAMKKARDRLTDYKTEEANPIAWVNIKKATEIWAIHRQLPDHDVASSLYVPSTEKSLRNLRRINTHDLLAATMSITDGRQKKASKDYPKSVVLVIYNDSTLQCSHQECHGLWQSKKWIEILACSIINWKSETWKLINSEDYESVECQLVKTLGNPDWQSWPEGL